MKKISLVFFMTLMSINLFALEGALSGKFSINYNGDQIVFSKGNLQAITTDFGTNWTWSFAANQWDYIGNAAANNAINGNGIVSENGAVDLFGWSTNTTYYGINNKIEYYYYSGSFVEWGDNVGNGWRTLSCAEWTYLFDYRTNANNLRGQATVNGIHGYVLLPDGADPTALGFVASPNNWTTNLYTVSQWAVLESSGAVFLPTTGSRNGTEVKKVSERGDYWSSTPYDKYYPYKMYFLENKADSDGWEVRSNGLPVRLVHEAPVSAIENTAINTKNSKYIINGQIFIIRGDKIFTLTGQQIK